MMNLQRAKEIKKLIDKYNISQERDNNFKLTGRLVVHNVDVLKASNEQDLIKESKQEIIEYFRRIFGDKIEGLKELKRATAEIEAYRERWNASFDNEYGAGGMGVGKRPEYDMKALRDKYPQAAAFLKAEELVYKYDYEQVEIGREAILEIVFGDYKKALVDMDEKLKKLATRIFYD